MRNLTSQLEVLYGMFHDKMLNTLKVSGRREPNAALEYWRDPNRPPGVIIPVPFNMVARACLDAQASSASVERLFSALGKLENNQAQLLILST